MSLLGTDRKSGWIRFRPDFRLQNPVPVPVRFQIDLPDFNRKLNNCKIFKNSKFLKQNLKNFGKNRIFSQTSWSKQLGLVQAAWTGPSSLDWSKQLGLVTWLSLYSHTVVCVACEPGKRDIPKRLVLVSTSQLPSHIRFANWYLIMTSNSNCLKSEVNLSLQIRISYQISIHNSRKLKFPAKSGNSKFLVKNTCFRSGKIRQTGIKFNFRLFPVRQPKHRTGRFLVQKLLFMKYKKS